MNIQFGDGTDFDTYENVFGGLQGYTLGFVLLKTQQLEKSDPNTFLYRFDATFYGFINVEGTLCFRVTYTKPDGNHVDVLLDVDNIDSLHIY